MDRKIIIIAILSILFIPSVFSAAELQLYTQDQPRCTDDGTLMFIAENIGNDELRYLPGNTIIYARNEKGETLRLPDGWLQEKIDFPKHAYDNKATYKTNEPFFYSKGHYTIIVFYPIYFGATQQGEVGQFEFIVQCPGQRYKASNYCAYLPIKVTDCHQDDKRFYAYFYVDKISTDYNIDYYHDFNFTLNYYVNNKGMKIYDPTPINYNVKQVGKDYYEFSAPLDSMTDKNTETIRIAFNACEESSTKRCLQLSRCTKDDDCEDNQVCSDENICKVITCNPCARVEDHSCRLSCPESTEKCMEPACVDNACGFKRKKDCCVLDIDCDDSLTCTLDTCIGGKCHHPDTICTPSEQACIDSICEEPTGCIYKENITCKNNLDNDITSKAIDKQDKNKTKKIDYLTDEIIDYNTFSTPKDGFIIMTFISICFFTLIVIFIYIFKTEKNEIKEFIDDLKETDIGKKVISKIKKRKR